MTTKSLFNLPQLAGLCSVTAACHSAQWSVEESVRRWKRLHYCLQQACLSITERIPAEPIYELKLIYSHHAYLLSEQVTAIRKRVSEMREPPLGLDKIPHAALERLMSDTASMRSRLAFLTAIYDVTLPSVQEACRQFASDAHPIADAPSVRVAKLIAFELEDLINVGRSTIQALQAAFAEHRQAHETESVAAANLADLGDNSLDLEAWRQHLHACLTAAGGLTGKSSSTATDEVKSPAIDNAIPDPYPFGPRFEYCNKPRRDQRFKDSYNAGVNPEAFLYDQRFSAQDKTLMMYYKRLREIDVPETIAAILTELDDKPWDFYREMLRQLWDEARHAMMGEIGFASQGIDWTQIPINFTWSLNLNTQLTPQERHGVLFFIEQGLMTRTGKRYEWEVGLQSHDPLSALFQDFDWADEVLHAQIGQRWYVTQFKSIKEALAYGDACWSRVLSHWQEYRDKGLTEHRNWWPELYQQACKRWGKQPDPTALEFNENYSNSRADLKSL